MNTQDNYIPHEIKSTEISEAFGEFMHAFETFQETNDRRLSEMERRLREDVLTKEKLDRVSCALDEQKSALDTLIIKKSRPALSTKSRGLNEYKSAFDNYIRTGEQYQISDIATKGERVNEYAQIEGGFFAPEELEARLDSSLKKLSPMRSLASVRKVSSSSFKKIVMSKGSHAGWAERGADDKRTEATIAPEFHGINFNVYELHAMPAISQNLLQDSFINLDEWIVNEIERVFAEEENKSFILGDGDKSPKGILDYTSAEEKEPRSFDDLICIDVNSSTEKKGLLDSLIDLIYSLDEGYRQNATWIMNRRTQATIRKIKDNQGNYIWQPPVTAGQKASLLGFPVVEIEWMEDETSTKNEFCPIAFGDFASGYLIIDRTGVQVLRDPYSSKPNILFYVTKRVGGGVQDFKAIRLLKIKKS